MGPNNNKKVVLTTVLLNRAETRDTVLDSNACGSAAHVTYPCGYAVARARLGPNRTFALECVEFLRDGELVSMVDFDITDSQTNRRDERVVGFHRYMIPVQFQHTSLIPGKAETYPR